MPDLSVGPDLYANHRAVPMRAHTSPRRPGLAGVEGVGIGGRSGAQWPRASLKARPYEDISRCR